MKRRNYIKTFVLGSVLPVTAGYDFPELLKENLKGPVKVNFRSQWDYWGDMKWVGPHYWGNRLQDWMLKGGKAICDSTGENRNLHLLTVTNPNGDAPLDIKVTISVLNRDMDQYGKGCIGFRLGAKGPFEDYRSAAVFGKGLDVGLDPKGGLRIGEKLYSTQLQALPDNFVLQFTSVPGRSDIQLAKVSILDPQSGRSLFAVEDLEIPRSGLSGNFALLADIPTENIKDKKASVAFSDWTIASEGLYTKEDNLFGPICFAQYTVHRGILKLTVQLAPIEQIEGHRVFLEFKRDGAWKTQEETQLGHEGRAVNFQVAHWNGDVDVPYRVRVALPLRHETHHYDYEGTIAREPINYDELKVAVFSCNADYGFPDVDVHAGVSKLSPDLSVFLGDQFYESSGGFGVEYDGDYDKTCLDYLRKWMMFGWSYREIFRHKPCAIVPDDHDVYHGNLWGEAGKKADTRLGFGMEAQDTGGYKMRAEWVNMVQFTQTSHLPEPFDPTPVKQGIGVYYTHWNYAGISFAILEDRKFKSAPAQVLPAEAQVKNGWIRADNFDIKQYRDLPAEMLGKRQESFLEDWIEDWSENAQMKAILSQTNFATVATLPKDAKSGAVIPSLYIPEKGEYIKDDRPTVDMDSNGWPPNKRDKAVATIRKAFAFHIAGDQHLASFIQYGLDEYGDSGYAFAGPALNNLWPRRFWPPKDSSGHTYEHPAYTGDHVDGFGNKMTVKAVANPHNMHKQPEILHNRAVGYGLVTFNKKKRTIKTDCFQRFKDPRDKKSQYPGWPQTISQLDNFSKKADAWLPELHIACEVLPVLKLYDENGKLVYAIRLRDKIHRPKVFAKGSYTIEISVPEWGYSKIFKNLEPENPQKKKLAVNIKREDS